MSDLSGTAMIAALKASGFTDEQIANIQAQAVALANPVDTIVASAPAFSLLGSGIESPTASAAIMADASQLDTVNRAADLVRAADTTEAAGPTFGISTVAEPDPALRAQPAPASAEIQPLLTRLSNCEGELAAMQTFLANLSRGIQKLPETMGVDSFADRLAFLERVINNTTGESHPLAAHNRGVKN